MRKREGEFNRQYFYIDEFEMTNVRLSFFVFFFSIDFSILVFFFVHCPLSTYNGSDAIGNRKTDSNCSSCRLDYIFSFFFFFLGFMFFYVTQLKQCGSFYKQVNSIKNSNLFFDSSPSLQQLQRQPVVKICLKQLQIKNRLT